MDFDCSQATLNALVKSLYSQEIEVGPDNVVEILTAADFLQATWLTTPLQAFTESKIVDTQPLFAFQLGQRFPQSHLCQGVIETVAKKPLNK